MTVIFCEVTFSYWNSDLEMSLYEKVRHAFWSQADADAWEKDLETRRAEALQQALDFEPAGVPTDASALEREEIRESVTELT